MMSSGRLTLAMHHRAISAVWRLAGMSSVRPVSDSLLLIRVVRWLKTIPALTETLKLSVKPNMGKRSITSHEREVSP